MANEILRLKQDVLNELRNDKYYSQDDLRVIVADENLSQRDKVKSVIDTVSKMVAIDAKIALVEGIFASEEQAPEQAPVDEPQVDNVVEADASELNTQGQTHAE